MEKGLNNSKSKARNHVRANLCKIAYRNGRENSFSGVLNVRLTKDIKIAKKDKFTLSADVFNFATPLN